MLPKMKIPQRDKVTESIESCCATFTSVNVNAKGEEKKKTKEIYQLSALCFPYAFISMCWTHYPTAYTYIAFSRQLYCRWWRLCFCVHVRVSVSVFVATNRCKHMCTALLYVRHNLKFIDTHTRIEQHRLRLDPIGKSVFFFSFYFIEGLRMSERAYRFEKIISKIDVSAFCQEYCVDYAASKMCTVNFIKF